ncbi:hypothetical protein [Nocardia pseudovaccinii]|uniref:hypothetical protein n=1 Tax=Nocardia pseudovaccinii TaxID=189540 RepID=UPI0007A53985|nr:hypothetical protein [Nocardia pseudovaccinii]
MPDDVFRWHAAATIVKFAPPTVRDMIRYMGGREPLGHEIEELVGLKRFTPDDIHHEDGNLLTTAGLGRLTSLFEGAGGAVFNNAQAIIGVGSSSTAAAVGDTALGGNGSTTTAYYQGADASYPTQSGGTINCNSTFGTGNANFAWNEWCLAIATGTLTAGGTLASVGTSPVMFNHKIASLGTKASGAIWTLQASCSIS